MADEIVGTAYVEIQAKFDSLKRSLARDTERALSGLKTEGARAGESIEGSMREAASQADRHLRQIGGADVWGDVKREAERAGESVESSFREAGRVGDRELGGISSGRGFTGLKTALLGLGGLLATLGVGAGIKTTVDQAADLGESINAIQVVLGDASGSFLDFGESAKSQLGLTRTELNTSIVPMAALLKNAGLEGEGLSRQLQDLAQRATDTGSVLNKDTTEVLTAFGAAIRGETEPARALGISFNDAAVQAKALELGLAGTSGELSEAAKTQARLALIMEQSDQFAGDFANTAESLPNTLKRLRASAIETGIGFGQALLPAVADVANGLVGLVDEIGPSLSELGGALAENLQPVFKTLGPAIAKMVPLITKVVGLVGKAFQTLAPLIEPLLDILSMVGESIIDALSSALDALQPVIKVVGQIVERLGPVLGRMLESVGAALDAIFVAIEPLLPVLGDLLIALVDAFAPILPVITDALLALVPPLADLLTALLPLLIPLTELITLFVEYGLAPAIIAITTAVTALADALGWLVGVVAEVVETVIGWFTDLYDTLVGNSIIPDLISGILEWFGKLPIELVKMMVELVSKLIAKWVELATAVGSKVGELIGKVVGWFGELPAKIVAALAGLASLVAGVFTGAVSAVRSGVSSLIGKVVGWFKELPGKIVDGLRFLASQVAGVFRFAVDTVKSGVSDLIGKVVGWFKELPGKIVDGVAKLAGSLKGLGESIVGWIIEGIRKIGGQITSVLRGLVPSPKDLVSGIIGGASKVAAVVSDYGRITTAPTLSWLSYDSQPEAVIPLTRPRRAMQLADESGLTDMILANRGGVPFTGPITLVIEGAPFSAMLADHDRLRAQTVAAGRRI